MYGFKERMCKSYSITRICFILSLFLCSVCLMHVCSWGLCACFVCSLCVFVFCACIAGCLQRANWWSARSPRSVISVWMVTGKKEFSLERVSPDRLERPRQRSFRGQFALGMSKALVLWYQVNSNIEKHNSIPVLGVSPLFNTPDSDHQLISWELHKLSVSVKRDKQNVQDCWVPRTRIDIGHVYVLYEDAQAIATFMCVFLCLYLS